jgi:hypothetical protein
MHWIKVCGGEIVVGCAGKVLAGCDVLAKWVCHYRGNTKEFRSLVYTDLR